VIRALGQVQQQLHVAVVAVAHQHMVGDAAQDSARRFRNAWFYPIQVTDLKTCREITHHLASLRLQMLPRLETRATGATSARRPRSCSICSMKLRVTSCSLRWS
jgi:hypothetical protein